MRSYQDAAEGRPDRFIRYDYPHLLDESRAAVAKLLGVSTDTVVLVSNATVGVNTVLRSLPWSQDGTDEILYFETIYGGCAKTVDYVVEDRRGLITSRCIPIQYPCSDSALVEAFRSAVAASRAAGRTPRVCLMDVVSSLPGVRVPFELLVEACRQEGVLSLVDGAQGIGMVDLSHLGKVNPDFFVSNCHKWLHVPRGCAVFYVPLRNQHLIRSSVPTSHGFVPLPGPGEEPRFNPLPPSKKSAFVNMFEFIGTLDNSPYLCVKDSIQWRKEVLGGEERIIPALTELARAGGKRVAEILGTKVLDNEEQSMTRCAMVNVALPLAVQPAEGSELDASLSGLPLVPKEDIGVVTNWILERLVYEYNTFVALFVYSGQWWARLSAQVYLEMEDFDWGGRMLREVCDRVAKGEYKSKE